jgi:hypothetical protein
MLFRHVMIRRESPRTEGESMVVPGTVDDYMAALPDDRRAVLEELRRTIRAAAPEAKETIAYQMPAFTSHGRFLVSFAAYRLHYSLFPASGAVRGGARRGADAVPGREGDRPLSGRRPHPRRARHQDRQGSGRRDRGRRRSLTGPGARRQLASCVPDDSWDIEIRAGLPAMSRATMRDRAASLDGAGGARSMVTVMILHDVDDVDHWLSSPRRMEFFGALG